MTNRAVNAEAAEYVRRAYQAIRDDPKARVQWVEGYIAANRPLISEADGHWQDHLHHSGEALKELEAVGDALSSLRDGVAAKRKESYWADVVVALHYSGALAFNQRHADRLIHLADAVRTRRADRPRPKVLLNSKHAYGTLEADAVEAAQLAYHVVMSSEEDYIPGGVVEILYQLSEAEGPARAGLAMALGHVLFKRKPRKHGRRDESP